MIIYSRKRRRKMEREIKNYRLNEFAQLIGVSIYTLQRWDRVGILKAKRSPTNRRYYTYEQYLEFKGMKQGEDVIISKIVEAIAEMSEGLSEEKKKKVVEIIKELEELKDNQGVSKCLKLTSTI